MGRRVPTLDSVPMEILLFGGSGTAGGAVLSACLASPAVETVRALTRRPLGFTHPKLQEIVHRDFGDYADAAEAFREVDACLFCLGISATQVSGEAEYRRITQGF